MALLPRRNNATELDAFELICRRLGGFARHIDFEWADGFLTALAAGATWPLPEGRAEAMADDAFDRAFADPDDRANAMRVIKARLSVLRDQLDAEALLDEPELMRLDPLLAEPVPAVGDEPALPGLDLGWQWAAGFMAALDLYREGFPREEGSEAAADYDLLTSQVEVLMFEDGSEEQTAFFARYYEGRAPSRDDLLTTALFTVQDLRLWAMEAVPVPPTRRVEKAPGRNDPCPCGSGRKYKKCHGA